MAWPGSVPPPEIIRLAMTVGDLEGSILVISIVPLTRAVGSAPGGPMNEREVAVFATRAFAVDAIRVRLWDEVGRVAGATKPSLDHFLAIASRCVRV